MGGIISSIHKAPFPSCLNDSSPFNKQGLKMQEMLEIFKQVHINLPLIDAIKQVPSYAEIFERHLHPKT